MIHIRGLEIEFDLTSPKDMQRYADAVKKVNESVETHTIPAQDDPEFMEKYVAFLNAELKVYGDFIDELFGEGVALQLLGSNPSLNSIYDVNDELGAALEKQGGEIGIRIEKIKKYKPDASKAGRKK